MDKQKFIGDLFSTAKKQNAIYTFDATRSAFLASFTSVIKPKKYVFNQLKIAFMVVSILGTMSLTLFLFPNSKSEVSNTKNSSNIKIKLENQVSKKSKITANFQFSDHKIGLEKKRNMIVIPDTLRENVEGNSLFINQSKIESNLKLKTNLSNSDEEYIFPKLTEEEIKANNKQKKLMLKNLEKFDKKVYAYIPTGTFDYQGKQVSVQSFYMQKTEISNLEYRTFLFDLLLQGRKDDFLKAKPDQNQWIILSKGQNSQMKEHYFSHSAYNHFPVVNISREGAEMYCKWFSQELNKDVDEKKRNLYNDIRIPMREEWVMAASIEGKNKIYPWEGDQTQNSEGLILANFKRLPNAMDSITHSDSTDITAPVKSYWANDFGLYNMSGNVAEMVCVGTTTKSAGTAGGGWMNTAEEIKILGPDPYAEVTTHHPVIGFRVVMTVKK